MPIESSKHLITELHDRFGLEIESAQQRELLRQLESHIHSLGEKEPVDPSFLDSLDSYFISVEQEHPNIASVLRQLIDTLKNIGV